MNKKWTRPDYYHQLTIYLHREKDKDLIDMLKRVGNKSKFVKDLLRLNFNLKK